MRCDDAERNQSHLNSFRSLFIWLGCDVDVLIQTCMLEMNVRQTRCVVVYQRNLESLIAFHLNQFAQVCFALIDTAWLIRTFLACEMVLLEVVWSTINDIDRKLKKGEFYIAYQRVQHLKDWMVDVFSRQFHRWVFDDTLNIKWGFFIVFFLR